MGFSMGARIIEDFLARSGAGRCQDLREVAEMLSKVGYKPAVGANLTPFPLTSTRHIVTGWVQVISQYHANRSLPDTTRSDTRILARL